MTSEKRRAVYLAQTKRWGCDPEFTPRQDRRYERKWWREQRRETRERIAELVAMQGGEG